MDLSLVVVGFVVGLLIGLTSMGGAALMTPFLILAGVKPVIAVGTDLVYGALTKAAGAWMHWRQRTVDLRMAWQLARGSLPGGLLGVLAIIQLRRSGLDPNIYLRRAIGLVLVVVAVLLILRTVQTHWWQESKLRLTGWRAPFWGFLVGFAVGSTSVGSGSLIVPLLMMAYPINPARAVGTDVFHAMILLSVTAAAHLGAGHVDWRLVPLLLAGSLPGVLLGSYLAARLPARRLRVGLAVVLFASGVKLI